MSTEEMSLFLQRLGLVFATMLLLPDFFSSRVYSFHIFSSSGKNDICRFSPGHVVCQRTCTRTFASQSSLSDNTVWVNGLECRPVKINIRNSSPIFILEATAEAQDRLVEDALSLDSEKSSESNSRSCLQKSDPYGAVLWPAALAVAEYVLDRYKDPDKVPDSFTILELGTGTGLVSLACSSLMSLHSTKNITILATDYEPVPLQLLEHAARYFNSPLIDETRIHNIRFELLDMCDNTPLPHADLILAADVLYDSSTARCLAKRVDEIIKRSRTKSGVPSGVHPRVIVGDSPGRPGRSGFLHELRHSYNIPEEIASFVDVVGQTVQGARNDLICGPGSTSVSPEPQTLTVSILDIQCQEIP